MSEEGGQGSARSLFLVLARDDVDTLLRVLAPFAVAGARGLRVTVTPLACDKSRIRIAARGFTKRQADLVAKRIDNIMSVERVGLGRAHKRREAASRQLSVPDAATTKR